MHKRNSQTNPQFIKPTLPSQELIDHQTEMNHAHNKYIKFLENLGWYLDACCTTLCGVIVYFTNVPHLHQ